MELFRPGGKEEIFVVRTALQMGSAYPGEMGVGYTAGVFWAKRAVLKRLDGGQNIEP